MPRGTLLAVREEKIVGWPTEVEAVLVAAQRRGDFIACTRPQPLADGRVFVIAKLRGPEVPKRRRGPDPVVATCVSVVVVVLGLLAWWVVTTVAAAARWVGDNAAAVGAAAVIALLLLLALTRTGRGCEITVIHRRH